MRTRRLLALISCTLLTATLLAPAPTAHADPQSKMMLVMDSSGSMKEQLPSGQPRIKAAKQALNTVIAGLPGNQAVGLRVYGADVFDKSEKGACTDSQRVVDLGTDNRAALKKAVKQYKPYGETPIGYALEQAGKDLGNEGQRTIVLVSDGEPTCQPEPCKVAADLAQAGIELKIEVVGLDVSGKARKALQCVADKGNGTYYDADDADDLTKALDTVATRAQRPYKPTGKPITGSNTAQDAPTITTGDWIDTIGGVGKKRSELFYTFHRTTPGSTLHLSASLTTLDDDDGLTMEVIGEEDSCGFNVAGHGVKYGQVISTSITAPGSSDWNEACTDNEDFTIRVSRGMGSEGKYGGDTTTEMEIRVQEEAPVESVDELPEKLPEPTYSEPAMNNPTKIVGGSSFAQATDIEPKAYKGSIVPGEVQIFAVDVDWGQHLTAAAKLPPLSTKLDDEVGSPAFNVKLFSPSRGVAQNTFESQTQASILSDGSEVNATSYAVAYRNRASFVDGESADNRAGTYYVVVGLSPDEEKSYQLPYTLGVSVDGKVRGEPTYLEEGVQPSESASAAPTPATAPSTPAATSAPSTQASDRPQSSPPSEEGSSLIRSLGWVLGGVGVLAVLGGIATAVIVLLRRRS